MPFSDLKKEFERIQTLLESGKAKYQGKDYSGASKDFEECLELLEKGHPEDHPDRIACLNGLGESYFALKQYRKAQNIYQILLKLDQANPQSSMSELVIRFKLAKSTERARAIEEAISEYEALTELAEKTLIDGHPFISNVLESHAALLMHTEAKETAKLLNKQARINRHRYSHKGNVLQNILSAFRLGGRKETDLRQSNTAEDEDDQLMAEIEDSIFSIDSGQHLSRRRLLTGPEGSPTRTFVRVCAAASLIVVAVTGIIYLSLQVPMPKAATEPKKAAPLARTEAFQPQSYFSLDGQNSVQFLDLSQARITSGRESKLAAWCKAGSPMAIAHMVDFMGLTEHDGYLTDGSGLKLYNQSAPELKIVKNMQALASAAERGYKLDSQYPEDLGRVLALGQGSLEANPVNSALPAVKIVYVGRDTEWNPDSKDQEPAALSQLAAASPLSLGDDLTPGCVYGYYVLSGQSSTGLSVKQFYIRACDHTGHFLPGSRRDTNLIFYCLNGKETEKIYPPVKAGVKVWQPERVGLLILTPESSK